MAKKKTQKKKVAKKKVSKREALKKKDKKLKKDFPTLKLKTEHSIAMDFAVKVSKKFNKMIKSIILFGSAARQDSVVGSDIDIIIILDDATIVWDQELIAWYREELDKILRANPYSKELHINTTKLTTWWEDLLKGNPTVINILRYGEAMIDLAGFFEPLKALLVKGKIRSSPEAIYAALQRAPQHLATSKIAELNAVEGLYWAMVDSAHAALIAANRLPPSPEHIAGDLNEVFVSQGVLKPKYVQWYRDMLILHKKINHRKINDLKGVELDELQSHTEEFLEVMANLVNQIMS